MKIGIILNYDWEWLINQPFFDADDILINGIDYQYRAESLWRYSKTTDEYTIKVSEHTFKNLQKNILQSFKNEMIEDFEEYIHELITNGEIQDLIKII